MGWTLCAATLAGGAHKLWGQGRIFATVLPFMLAHGAAAATQAESEAINLPSGQAVTLLEQRGEPDIGIFRLRYIAPDLASPLTRPSFDALTEDLEFLCARYAEDLALSGGEAPAQIVISLSAEPVEFGVTNADVEQVFEAFRLENGSCMLEMF